MSKNLKHRSLKPGLNVIRGNLYYEIQVNTNLIENKQDQTGSVTALNWVLSWNWISKQEEGESQFILSLRPNICKTILSEYLHWNHPWEILTVALPPSSVDITATVPVPSQFLTVLRMRREGERSGARCTQDCSCYPNPGSVTSKPETTICVSTCNFNQIS